MKRSKKNWPIDAGIDIKVSSHQVWQLMTSPTKVSLYHPFVKNYTTTGAWGGMGSQDQITYNSGASFDRKVTGWFEGAGYDLNVADDKGNELVVTWRIREKDEDNCRLEISVVATSIEKLPLPIRWFVIRYKLKPIFSSYLAAALQGFRYYAENGIPVCKNQFGSHPIFSPE